jgi:lipopolysaccharide transport system permease protein
MKQRVNVARRYLELVLYRAGAELRAEVARGYLGYFWWVAEPVIYMLAFYVSFGTGLRGGGVDYMLFLLVALVPWKWFASSYGGGSNAFRANAGLSQQVRLPKAIFPLVLVLKNGFKFLIILALLIIVLQFAGKTPDLYWLYLPFLMVVELALICAVSTVAAAVVGLIPDAKILVSNSIILLMFLSGIFFDVNRLSPHAQAILGLNPLVHIFNGYRNVLLKHKAPSISTMVLICVVSLAVYAITVALVQRYERTYSKALVS